MRFIHTADWHLGRLFHGRHLTDDQAFVLEDFQRIVRHYRPDAVLVAGDIYDRAVPPTEAVELLDETLARLVIDEKTPVVMIAGNHDSPERVGFGGRLLAREGLSVTGRLRADTRPAVFEDAFGEVWVCPLPYSEPALVRNLFPESGAADHAAALEFLARRQLALVPEKARKIAVAHAFVAGGAVSESERPLSVGGSENVPPAVFAPFDYAALGHLHNPQSAGGERIRYAGSLMKYSFDEAHQKKGVVCAELGKDGALSTEFVPLVPKRDVCRVEGYLTEILSDRGRYPKTEDYIAVTLLDKQAILDARGQLEAVYPNLMQVERPALYTGGELAAARGDRRGKGERRLFAEFFAQMTGEALTDGQSEAFAAELDALAALRREAGL